LGLPQYFLEEHVTFETDRSLIVALSDRDAKSVLGLLDNNATHAETPAELRAALAAAQRSPEVSRYFLVNKQQKDEHHAAQKRQKGTSITQ
jgi:hypothetical protein